jgi:hypothetical protein
MMVWKLMGPLTACALTLGTLCGCSLAVTPPGGGEPPPDVTGASSGTLTINWSVAGTGDPGLCAMYRADQIEVVVYDASGAPVATANAPCANFSTTVPLAEGLYSADVTLVDQAGNAITTTKLLHALSVVGGTDLAVSIDFPQSSVL